MSDHDQPYYPPFERVEIFCPFCRKYFSYFKGLEDKHDEHVQLEKRLERYVGNEHFEKRG